jgi:hypothetical protein
MIQFIHILFMPMFFMNFIQLVCLIALRTSYKIHQIISVNIIGHQFVYILVFYKLASNVIIFTNFFCECAFVIVFVTNYFGSVCVIVFQCCVFCSQ